MVHSALRAAAVALLGAAALVSVGLASANAAAITFDDVNAAPEAAIPNGYKGLNWSNWSTIDPGPAGVTPATSGYFNSVTSGSWSAFNIDGNPSEISSASPFSLLGGNFTAAWSNDLKLTITGFDALNNVLHSLVLDLDTNGPLPESFVGWTGLSRVTFSATATTDIEGLVPPRTNFAVDDLQVVATPIPGSLLLLLTGIGAIGGIGYTRRRGAAVAQA